jgi:hypothetical protein
VLGSTTLALFVLAGLLLNITPGPDMLYIIGRSTRRVSARRGGHFRRERGLLGAHRRRGARHLRAHHRLGDRVHDPQVGGRRYLIYVGISMMKPGTDA